MKALLGLIQVLSIPLMILNMLGGAVSGVWLLILGEWRLLAAGLLVVLVGRFVLMIAFLPSVIFGAPALYFASKEKWTISNILMLPSILYINTVMIAWCGIVFYYYTLDSTLFDLIPRMIWSYGIATAPLSYMAMKRPRDENAPTSSTIAILFTQIGSLFVMLRVVMSSGATLHSIGMTFAGFMLAAALIQWVLSFLIFHQHELEDGLPS